MPESEVTAEVIIAAAETIAGVFAAGKPTYYTHVGDNIADVTAALSFGIHAIAKAITPLDAAPCEAANGYGRQIGSLTEAVADMAMGLRNISDAIEDLAGAVREHGA